MLKKFLLLCLILSATTKSFSQDTLTVTITENELKTANLIFLEHEELSKKVPLLNQEISNLQLINKTWEHTDSIRVSQINTQNESINKLKKSLDKQKRIVKYGAIGTCILFVTCLLVK